MELVITRAKYVDKVFTHIKELFDGQAPKIVKSHCFLCHKEIRLVNHKRRGNCCLECDFRCARVAREILSQKESDRELMALVAEPVDEVWLIDGVEYIKKPNGKLIYERTKIQSVAYKW